MEGERIQESKIHSEEGWEMIESVGFAAILLEETQANKTVGNRKENKGREQLRTSEVNVIYDQAASKI